MARNYKKEPNGKGSKTRNKKGSGKVVDKRDKFDSAELDARGRDNDPNYYFTSKELAAQAAQLSFQNVLGGAKALGNYYVPTVMTIEMNPSMGYSYANDEWIKPTAGGQLYKDADPGTDLIDGVNLMATKMYTLLSTFSGRTSVYQPCDIAAMIGGISSIAELSEHLRRVFGVALTYNPRNRALPAHLIKSMGINPDDLFQNLADYRARFNVLMTQINQIPLLDNIGYIKKSRELYQKVYMDNPSDMSQLYVFKPYSVWILDESTYSKGTVLKTYTISAYTTMGIRLNNLSAMIQALLKSSTLNIVYADLLNLANKVKVPTWQFDYLADNYVVMPEYNENALLQIHNLTVMGAPYAWNTTTYPMDVESDGNTCPWRESHPADPADNKYKITYDNDVACDPDTGSIVYTPVFNTVTTRPSAHDVIVDTLQDSPSEVDIIEMMRFTSIWSGLVLNLDYDSQTSQAVEVATFFALPDHYVVQANIYSSEGQTPVTLNNSDITSLVTYQAFMVRSTQFNKCFIMYDMSSNAIDVEAVFGDMGFFTTVGYNYLNRNNRLMYEGLFDFRL